MTGRLAASVLVVVLAVGAVAPTEAGSLGSIGTHVTADPLGVSLRVPARPVRAGDFAPVTVEATNASVVALVRVAYGIAADGRSIVVRGPLAGPSRIGPYARVRAVFLVCARSPGLFVLVARVRAATSSGTAFQAVSGGAVLDVRVRARASCR